MLNQSIIATLSAATASILLVESGRCSLPVFAGPGINPNGQTGFVNPYMSPGSRGTLTNAGNAIVGVDYQPSNGTSAGGRVVTFNPDTAAIFGGISSFGGSAYSTPYSINGHNTVVGQSMRLSDSGATLGQRAARWLANGQVVELDGIGTDTSGYRTSAAFAINKDGYTIGYTSKHIGAEYRGTRAIRWAPDSSAYFEMGVLSSNNSFVGHARAVAINSYNTVVGTSDQYMNDAFKGTRAVRWSSAGTIKELTPLGSTADGYAEANAIDVNESAMIVGTSRKYTANHVYLGERAVRWNINGAATELGTLGTSVSGTATAKTLDINNAGLVVGMSEKYLFGSKIGTRATYWYTPESTAAFELPTLGTSALGATDAIARVSNADNIIAGTTSKYDLTHTYLGERAVIWLTRGNDAVIELESILPADSGWRLTDATSISDTGFVSGIGTFDPDGLGSAVPYKRSFSMLIPQAGTYGRGDANFDTLINFDDLLLLAQHYGESNVSQNVHVADLNLDGSVNFDDLLALAQHYDSGGAINTSALDLDFASDWALARSVVPEPSIVTTLVCFSACRRRR